MKLAPQPKKPVVDRLAFVLQWGCDPYDGHDEMLRKVRLRIDRQIAAGVCERAYLGASRYRENFRILVDGGSKALVQIGAVDPVRQKGGVRIELNPAKFKPGDVQQLHLVMRKIIGRCVYNRLMRKPLLQVIHFAVDILHLVLSNALVQYQNAQLMTVIAKRVSMNGIVEGYNYGSVSSNYQTAVYDKHRERVHAAVLALAKEGAAGMGRDPLKNNKVRQLDAAINGCETTRVEVRSKKMRGLPLWKLPQQTNRFARFRFADLSGSGSELPPFVERAFLAICRQDGVKVALAAFKHDEHARKVHKYWRSRQAAWWQPEQLWEQACEALRESKIFPTSAFEQPTANA